MNKKLLVVAFAVALVFGSLVSVAEAGNFISKYVVPHCKYYVSNGYYYDNVGDCVSDYARYINNRNDWPAKFCQDYWYYFGFDNVGDCVSFHRNWK